MFDMFVNACFCRFDVGKRFISKLLNNQFDNFYSETVDCKEAAL